MTTANLIAVDVADNVIDSEQYMSNISNADISDIDELLRDQYVDLEDLGNNLLASSDIRSKLNVDSKFELFKPMVEFVDQHYITIGDMDSIDGSPTRLETAGEYIYEFICVDNVNAILPAFIESIDCYDIAEFDSIVNKKYLNNIGRFRDDYLGVIQLTIKQLFKLQTLDAKVKQDIKYQKLLAKHYYYQEIIDYGDCEQFLNNYVRPVLNMYFPTLIWRLI